MAAARTHSQLVSAAVADGRISAACAQTWINALAADPVGTRRILASLTPMPVYSRPRRPDAEPPRVEGGLEAIHNKITAGYAPWRTDLGGYPTESSASDGRFELVESGRDPTVEERMNGALFEISRGAAGERTPGKTSYIRDNTAPRLVEHRDGTAHWEYQAVPAWQLPAPERPDLEKAAEEARQVQQLEASLRRFI